MTDTPDMIPREEADARVAAALREAALIGASSYGADMDAEALILDLIPDAGAALDRAIAEAVQIVLDDVGYTFDQLGEKAQRELRNRIEKAPDE